MELNELIIGDYTKRNIHKVINENFLISTYFTGKGHLFLMSEKSDGKYLSEGYDNNLIFVL